MKTDIEKLKALLDEFGIGYEDNSPQFEHLGSVVLVEYGMAKVGGYGGFFAAFVFDGFGKFINVEVGE